MGGTEESYFPDDFKYLCLSTADVDYEDLSVHFNKTSAFIEEGVQQASLMSQNLSDCILKFSASKCHVFAGLDPPKRSQKLVCSYACYDIDLRLA